MVRFRLSALAMVPALWTLGAAGCQPDPDAAAVIERGIEVHGGERFRNVRIDFDLRGDRFTVRRENGRFRHERVFRDEEGREVREIMTNDSTWREVAGRPAPLDEHEVAGVELAVNSVVYFAFLPFRLDDPPVRARLLEPDTIGGEPYQPVEVTFEREGGGPDWDDRFVHWFHAREGTLDYLAYRYHRGEGGTRFRAATNRREAGGLLLQDYRNYRVEGIDDIQRYPDYLERGELEHVSDVVLEAVTVTADPGDP